MEDLISGAVELLTLGMTTVFVFLGVLVGATSLMSRVMRSVAPDPPPVGRPPKRIARGGAVNPQTRKAIELAVARYRNEH